MKYKLNEKVFVIDQDILKSGVISGYFDPEEKTNPGHNAYFIKIDSNKEVARSEDRIYSSIKDAGASIFRLFPEGMAFVM